MCLNSSAVAVASAEDDVATPVPEVATAESLASEEVAVTESAAAADTALGDDTTESAGECREMS